ncbi:Phosphoglucomutase [bioreactor metagenome]|uniref:Phosphoglucomutase n=1 Tax=bioreactor metagenome TaxID=1076179 RepID=A0A645ISB9_9ZZZZ
MMICEMASWYKRQGMTLMDAYEQLEGRYGVFISALETLCYEGRQGEELMRAKMDALREANDIAGLKILEKTDYMRDDTGLPRSNVLRFLLEGGRQAVFRPSGTEPLLKLYLTLRCDNRDEGEREMEKFRELAVALCAEEEK